LLRYSHEAQVYAIGCSHMNRLLHALLLRELRADLLGKMDGAATAVPTVPLAELPRLDGGAPAGP
jgi:hypothetical protein